jgi:hypothetical protein
MLTIPYAANIAPATRSDRFQPRSQTSIPNPTISTFYANMGAMMNDLVGAESARRSLTIRAVQS